MYNCYYEILHLKNISSLRFKVTSIKIVSLFEFTNTIENYKMLTRIDNQHPVVTITLAVLCSQGSVITL